MFKITKHRNFKKYYKKLSKKQQGFFVSRLKMFCKNPHDPTLRLHRLTGDLRHFYVFSVGGDLRVVFQWADKDTIFLCKLGTHNQVY